MKLCDFFCVSMQHGTIRFGGITEFQPGQWAGIELDEPIGKNDGSYGGIRYFTCKSKFGLFVPMHRISKDNSDHQLVADKKKRKKTERHSITSMAIEAQSHLRMNNEIEVRTVHGVLVGALSGDCQRISFIWYFITDRQQYVALLDGLVRNGATFCVGCCVLTGLDYSVVPTAQAHVLSHVMVLAVVL